MNRELRYTLEDSVTEVLNMLTGLTVTYDPGNDRFRAVAMTMNRALRSIAREHEWSYFYDTEEVGQARGGCQHYDLPTSVRPRIMGDDAVRLVDDRGVVIKWAYFLPRDAIHKYRSARQLYAVVNRTELSFNRPLLVSEAGLRIMVPVMREPKQFKIPPQGEEWEQRTLNQLLDFDNPDLVMARCAYMYAQTDPVMQPRVQTLEQDYNDIKYALIEREERHTESPLRNEIILPMQGSLYLGRPSDFGHRHPHSDARWV